LFRCGYALKELLKNSLTVEAQELTDYAATISNCRPADGILSVHFNQLTNHKIMKEQEIRSCKRTLIAAPCLLLITLLGATAFRAQVGAADQPPMTVILVRHAEKKIAAPENKDPDLSPAGIARAQELARIFGNSGIAAIYATQYKRTQQTVRPLADKLGLSITQVEAGKTSELVKQIRARNAGQVIFIAGHNNSVPEIIAALGGPQLPIIPEAEFDNLYILTIQNEGSARLLKMKYGSPLLASRQEMMKQ
jgi:2,3-bisphosphoglycerate-dependent phosphoglycerate mutase